MKKDLESIKIGELAVSIAIEEREHPGVHAILFTATCGESVKESVMTLNVPDGATDEDVARWVSEHARTVAEEAANHERGRLAKKKLFGA